MNLKTEDRQAVDLLLDAGAWEKTLSTIAATESVSPARINAVRQLLDTLNHLPSDEPPADLVSRTLRRIEESTNAPGGHAGDGTFVLPVANL